MPAGRLRLPVGACEAAGAAGADGRTSIGRRGGAGGAWPVFGSSTRSRSVGGSTRPVGGGITGRGAGGGSGLARRRGGGCRGFFDDKRFRHVRGYHRFFDFDWSLCDRGLDNGDRLGFRHRFRHFHHDVVRRRRHVRDLGRLVHGARRDAACSASARPARPLAWPS